MPSIGDRVREARERASMKSADLARATGLTPGAVSRIETGKRVPGSQTVARLAAALGVEAGSLLSGVEAPQPARGPRHIVAPPDDMAVVQAIQLVARVMPTLPPTGRARVLRIIEAALGPGVEARA